MATETLRTDRVRNDKEASEGPPTLNTYEGMVLARSFKGLA
jgi:hypothetical protein